MCWFLHSADRCYLGEGSIGIITRLVFSHCSSWKMPMRWFLHGAVLVLRPGA